MNTLINIIISFLLISSVSSLAPLNSAPKSINKLSQSNNELLTKSAQILTGLTLPYFLQISTTSAAKSRYPIFLSDDVMKPKAHGTSQSPVQSKLRWNCDVALADKMCNYNRNWAEFAGYWRTTSFLTEVTNPTEPTEPITFYDSVTGLPLFRAPVVYFIFYITTHTLTQLSKYIHIYMYREGLLLSGGTNLQFTVGPALE